MKSAFTIIAGSLSLSACLTSGESFHLSAIEQQGVEIKKLCPNLQNVQLEWDGAPYATKSYLVVGEGVGNLGNKVFWVAYNIPRRQESLDNQKKIEKDWQIGRNDFGSVSYENPCQAIKGLKQVKFTVYAISEKAPRFFVPPTQKDLMAAFDKKIMKSASVTLK